MGKNPAFLFYPGDWSRDLDDQDLEIEGAWIRICCRLWWSETKGEATKSVKEWARILRKTEKKTMKIFQILFIKHIASGCILDNQNITIISRRMIKDCALSKVRHEVGKLGGNPKLKKKQNKLVNQTDNQKSTLSVSVSVSSFLKDLEDIYTHWNSRGIIVHKKLTDVIKRKIDSALKDRTQEEIIQAINNYAEVLKSENHYWNHKWTLEDFLTRGLNKFVDEADPINNFRRDAGKNLQPVKPELDTLVDDVY